MIEIENRHYSIQEIGDIVSNRETICLSARLVEMVTQGRKFLEEFVSDAENPIYGINTGFGSLCDVQIAASDLSVLQENLVKSHAAGAGEKVAPELVRYMLLLKIFGLSKGNSGVRLKTVQMLIELYNHDIIPVVYEQGSLGASGDLAPLAHMCLPLLGLGQVWFEGGIAESKQVLDKCGLSAIKLASKEGLALLNGTQFMSAHATYILYRLRHWLDQGDKIAALSLDAYNGRIEPFDDAVHAVRPHRGQGQTALKVRELLRGSELIAQSKKHVQDPYSFRCIPQVHGASRDAIDHIIKVVEIEINSVTDNPTLVPDEGKIVSAGNFHGQPLAINLDYLCIALAELASISERRIYKLIGGERGLPAYLVAKTGLNSGLMIAQYTAASIVSQNKQLCTPASVDTIDSSNGQEDHVSMGANAATKALKVLQNYQTVVAIELLTAAQAMGFRKNNTSPKLSELLTDYRTHVAFIEDDVVIQPLIEKTLQFLN